MGVGVDVFVGFGVGVVVGCVDGTGNVVVEGALDGLEVVVGLTVAVIVAEGDARCGAANGVAGRFANARSINSFHISAGKDAPTTAMPRTSVIALKDPAYPFQTTAASSGV